MHTSYAYIICIHHMHTSYAYIICIHMHTDTYTYIHIHTYTYQYIPIHTNTYHYIPLHTITYHYIPLHTIAYHYIPLHTITYHYIPSHTITYHYLHSYIHMYRLIFTVYILHVYYVRRKKLDRSIEPGHCPGPRRCRSFARSMRKWTGRTSTATWAMANPPVSTSFHLNLGIFWSESMIFLGFSGDVEIYSRSGNPSCLGPLLKL